MVISSPFDTVASIRSSELTRGILVRLHRPFVCISIANDDICYQDGGNSYVRGYSQGAQKAWLEKEFADPPAAIRMSIGSSCACTRSRSRWLTCSMAGTSVFREEWVPVIQQDGVDLVVCGHEHHAPALTSDPRPGAERDATLVPAATATDVIDTTQGTVHMVIGGGGTSAPSNQSVQLPQCRAAPPAFVR